MKPRHMRFHIGQKSPSNLSQLCLPSFDLKKLYAKLILEPPNGIANRGLRPIELLGGGRISTKLDHGLKDLPGIERSFHDARIHRINRYTRRNNETILRESSSSTIRLNEMTPAGPERTAQAPLRSVDKSGLRVRCSARSST